jgi:hypothetical protein
VTAHPKVLAYLLYGPKPEYRAELTFSVLTALRLLGPQDEVQIVIVTDEAEALRGLPVRVLPLAAGEMREWTQDGAYTHRAKPLALRKVLREFGAAAALVDTDTYFKGDPRRLFERIGPGRALMHDREGYTLAGATEWLPVVAAGVVPADTEMLNSGVIGVDPEDAGLLERAVETIDRIRAVAPVFNAEQVGVALGLRTEAEIGFCADVLAHYWGYLRPFLLLEVQRFLAANAGASADALIAGSAGVRVELPPKRLVDRVAAKALSKLRGWSPGYGYAWLCYRTGLAYAGKDPEVATLWVASALHALKQCGAGQTEVRRDFGGLARVSWLGVKVAEEWRDFAGYTEGQQQIPAG